MPPPVAQPWADTPFQLVPTPFGNKDLSAGNAHGAQYVAQQMTHLHNCIIRLLNSIYNQAPYVQSPEDIRDFLAYVKHWHDEMEHHHHTEEECMFPLLEKITGDKKSMEINVQQHEAFMPGLEALNKYVTETKIDDYDGRKLQAIIDGFGDDLATHLTEEIPTLIALEKYDDKQIRKMWNSVFWYVIRTADFHKQLPMQMSAFDVTWEDGKSGDLEFPPPAYPIVNLWYWRRHKNSWKFLPCTLRGQPKSLYAIPR